MYAITSLA